MQDINDDAIATAAYHIWVSEGRPHGSDEDHWERARLALTAAATLPAAKAKRAAKPKAPKVSAAQAEKPATAKPRRKAPAKPRKAAKS